jgi:hypothetical protein
MLVMPDKAVKLPARHTQEKIRHHRHMARQIGTAELAKADKSQHGMQRYTTHNGNAPVNWLLFKSKVCMPVMPDKAVKVSARHTQETIHHHRQMQHQTGTTELASADKSQHGMQ